MAIPFQLPNSALVDVFSDLLVLGYQLRQARDLGSPDSIRLRLEQMFQEADRLGIEQGIFRDTLMDARFAVVAFLDEMILSSGWPHKEEWASRPLQFQYFETNVAGEEFFTKLDSFRRALPINPDLLEIYHVCLVLGFEGQYKLAGREKLKDLIHDLFRDIQGRRGEPPPLSPHAQRHEEVLEVVKRDLPAWVMAVCAVAVVFFLYVSLSVLIHQEGSSVAESLRTLASNTVQQ